MHKQTVCCRAAQPHRSTIGVWLHPCHIGMQKKSSTLSTKISAHLHSGATYLAMNRQRSSPSKTASWGLLDNL